MELKDYISEEKYCSLTLKESYEYACVMRITVLVIDSWDDAMNGRKLVYNPESKACFAIPCDFSECYGVEKGFKFDSQIRAMVRDRLSSSAFRVECGGYGDHAKRHRCDNWIEVHVAVDYYPT